MHVCARLRRSIHPFPDIPSVRPPVHPFIHPSIVHQGGRGALELWRYELVFKYCYPRLDVNVSKVRPPPLSLPLSPIACRASLNQTNHTHPIGGG